MATPFFNGVFGIVNGSAVLENVACTGNESTFLSLAFQCNHPGLGNISDTECLHPFRAAGVRCQEGKYSQRLWKYTLSLCIFYAVPPPCPEGNVQLGDFATGFNENGDYFEQGRVEICVNGTYGTICDIGWDDADATVICRNLGYDAPFFGKSQGMLQFMKM